MVKKFQKIALSVLGVAFMATAFVGCSSDDSGTNNNEQVEAENTTTNDSSNTVFSYPDCEHPVLVEVGTLKMHRKSKNCRSGFSLCTRYDWVRDCFDDVVDEEGNIPGHINPERYMVLTPSVRSVVDNGGTLIIVDELPNQNQLRFQFSLNILDSKDYQGDDLETFVVEEDGFEVDSYRLKQGTYRTEVTATALQVLVDIY